jgi:hypothetical protein
MHYVEHSQLASNVSLPIRSMRASSDHGMRWKKRTVQRPSHLNTSIVDVLELHLYQRSPRQCPPSQVDLRLPTLSTAKFFLKSLSVCMTW